MSSSLSRFVTKNDISYAISDLQKTNLVYELPCNKGGRDHLKCSYVGVSETTSSGRLTMHEASGALKTH